MENATKALLIAGGVLLMILVMSFAVYMFNRIGGQTSEHYEKLNQSYIDEFNNNFSKYVGLDLKIHDVVSIINYAKSGNNNANIPIQITIDNLSVLGLGEKELKDIDSNTINKLLKEKMDEIFTCEVDYGANEWGLIEKITINKK